MIYSCILKAFNILVEHEKLNTNLLINFNEHTFLLLINGINNF